MVGLHCHGKPYVCITLVGANLTEPYLVAGSSDFLKIFVPLYMVISLSQFITYLLVLIVGEKEAKIKDGLKQMGLRDSVYWWVGSATNIVKLLLLLPLP